VTGSDLPEITQAWIRQVHQVMLASQETYRVYVDSQGGVQDRKLPLGDYKTTPNSPTGRVTGEIHWHAPPGDTHSSLP
jgi:hypothetical protein